MAGPLVTALLTPNPASGTWAPSSNATETTLASGTAAGTYQLRMDLGATGGVAAGDVIEVRVYTYAGGTTERLAQVVTVWGGGPAPTADDEKVFISAPFPTSDDYKVTARLRVGGTSSRSFPWDVINLNGA